MKRAKRAFSAWSVSPATPPVAAEALVTVSMPAIGVVMTISAPTPTSPPVPEAVACARQFRVVRPAAMLKPPSAGE